MSQQTELDENTAVMQLNLEDSLVSRALRGAMKEMNPNANVRRLDDGKSLTMLGEPGPIVEHRTLKGYDDVMAVVYHNGAREKASQLIDRFLKYWGRMPTWAYDN
jgi:hypothetical protein